MPAPRDLLAQALVASWRDRGLSIMADDWPGVVACGDGWRIILRRDGEVYHLQRVAPGKRAVRRWNPTGFPYSRRVWRDELGPYFPGLAEAVERLPLDPLDAVAALLAAQGVVVPAVERRAYWRDADYSGVLAVDGNFRAVRDRTGTLYAVQWLNAADFKAGRKVRWVTQHVAPRWPDLVEALAPKVFDVEGDMPRSEAAARLRALFDGLPELAADGPWPVVKVQPPASGGPAGETGPARPMLQKITET